ncbi:UNVERIFIED_CONTAM: hypothetical protein GTU68_010591 [Idotea baltica]|jgi:hypothetical protein
MLIC